MIKKYNFFSLKNVKKTLLSGVLLAIGQTSYAQIATNNFNTDMGGWEVVHTVGDSGNIGWTRETSSGNPTTPAFGCDVPDGCQSMGMAKLACYDINEGNQYELNSPAIAFGEEEYQITFQMYRDSGYPGKTNEKIEVFFNATTASSEGGISIGEVHRHTAESPIAGSTGWYEYTFLIPSETAESGYISILGTPEYGNNIYIDEIVIEEVPTCIKPTNFSAEDITSDSATLSWTESTSMPTEGYEYYYSIDPTDPNTETPVSGTVATNNVTITNLESSKYYSVWIRSVCSNTDKSSWYKAGFRTTCPPAFVIDYEENFDGALVNEMSDCWSILVENTNTVNSSLKLSDSNSFSGENSMRIYTSDDTQGSYYVISPNFSDIDNNKAIYLQLMRDTSEGLPENSGTFEIGVLTDPTDTSTYTLIKSIPVSNIQHNQVWQEFMITTTEYTGGAGHIVIKYTPGTEKYIFLYIDDFKYNSIPSCIKPSGLSDDNVTISSADISWEASSSNPEKYEYYYSTENTDPTANTIAMGETTETTINITDLNHSTSYYLWIRSKCNDSEYSDWSSVRNIKTKCGVIVPEYLNEFNIASQFPGVCWKNLSGDEANPDNTSGLWNSSNFLSASDGSKAAKINIYSTTNSWLISTTFDLSESGYTLSFDYGLTKFNSIEAGILGDDDKVQIMISEDGGTTWTPVQTFTSADNITNTTNEYSYEITSSSDQVKFAIYAESTLNNKDNDFYIDNFKITKEGLSINEIGQAKNKVTIYPNPFKNIIGIETVENVTTIRVLDISGKVVKSYAPQKELNLSDLKTGTYLINLYYEDGSIKTLKAIKK